MATHSALPGLPGALRPAHTIAAVSLLLLGTPALAQSDLVLSVDGPIPAGTYHNVEILPGINGTVSGVVTVTGTFQVDSAAEAAIGDGDYITGNNFKLMNDARLRIQTAAGIDGTTTGPIRTMTKDFGTKGRFTFNNATQPQFTGPGMADEVSELVINNAAGVTLTKAIGVRERLWLRNGNLITNGHQLTLISREPDIAMVTAASALIFNQNGAVVGNVTTQRYINPRYNAGTGYRHFSSSVSGPTVADLNTAGFSVVVNPQYNAVPYSQRFMAGNVLPFPNTFYFDESQVGTGGPGTYDEVFVQGYQSPNSQSDPLVTTRGYSVRIPANAVVDFVGQPNNGPINTGPLTRGALNESGWHLVGNPYPSKIDWTLLTRTNMFNQFSKYRSTGPTEGVYDTYVNGISTGPSGNEFIAANQAVFVRASTPGVPGNIQFDNVARLVEFRDDPTAPFFRGTASNPRPLTRLTLEGGHDLRAEAVVYFEQGATPGIDVNHDGFYINGGYPVGIYSQVGAEHLAINGQPALTASTDVTVPFVVNIRTAGTYRLNATELLNLPAGTQVLLQDAVTGQSQDLTLNPVYPFTSTGQYAQTNRFTVRYRGANVTGTIAETISASGFDVYPNPVKGTDRLNLVLPGIESGKAITAALYNDLGQQVWTNTYRSALGGVREEISTKLARGIYTLQLALPDGSKPSRRVVVQ